MKERKETIELEREKIEKKKVKKNYLFILPLYLIMMMVEEYLNHKQACV